MERPEGGVVIRPTGQAIPVVLAVTRRDEVLVVLVPRDLTDDSAQVLVSLAARTGRFRRVWIERAEQVEVGPRLPARA